MPARRERLHLFVMVSFLSTHISGVCCVLYARGFVARAVSYNTCENGLVLHHIAEFGDTGMGAFSTHKKMFFCLLVDTSIQTTTSVASATSRCFVTGATP